jgi:Multicopper oxidase
MNLLGDAPFTGELVPVEKLFNYTDITMAFDVILEKEDDEQSDVPSWSLLPPVDLSSVDNVRRVGLFEGMDEFGRLQPLLGGEDITNIIETFTWSEPITEKPALGDVEEWEIFNLSGDAHPIHLHLVAFQVMGRYPIVYDSNADTDNLCPASFDPAALDGKCKGTVFHLFAVVCNVILTHLLQPTSVLYNILIRSLSCSEGINAAQWARWRWVQSILASIWIGIQPYFSNYSWSRVLI